jgi:hypothetical protein
VYERSIRVAYIRQVRQGLNINSNTSRSTGNSHNHQKLENAQTLRHRIIEASRDTSSSQAFAIPNSLRHALPPALTLIKNKLLPVASVAALILGISIKPFNSGTTKPTESLNPLLQ